jgi:uncharacterized protein YukE
MSDEYVQRYQQVSHEELYSGVQAGDAEQIETLASKWSSLKTTLDGLSQALRDDLDALGRTWTGAAGEEFQRRLDLVVEYSNSLATGMGGVHEGLTLMAGPLRTAQKQAESPDETDDHDQALKGAAKGAILGPAGALVGGFLGHQQDKEEQEKAHQRMVQVVAELAATYDLSAYDRWTPPPAPHPETPETVSQTSSTARNGPGATPPTGAPDSGPSARIGTAKVVAPQSPKQGPVVRHDRPAPDSTTTNRSRTDATAVDGSVAPGTGTSLAGVALLAGWAAGAGGMVATAAGGTGSGNGLFPNQSTATPLGTGALAGSPNSGAGTTARPGGSGAGPDGRSATGAGRAEAGSRQGTASAGERSSAGGRSAAGRSGVGAPGRPGVLGGSQGQLDEDESDDRLTWLTEDDMVWQGDGNAAPPVLGSPEH